MVALGATEGIAELIAGFVKIWAGRWSDRTGQRKVFVFWGYVIAAVAKPMSGMATHWLQALTGRGFDRFGKGIRTAPRDAMLGDWAPPGSEAKVFGFHRGMDTLGATIGPLVTLGILLLWPALPLSYLFFIAFVPGMLAAFLVLAVPEKKLAESEKVHTPLASSLSRFPPIFYFYMSVWAIFSVANSSDVFLLLQVQKQGASQTQVILSYCFFNLIYAALSFPLGAWADRRGTRQVFKAGLFLFVAVYGIFAVATEWWQVILGLALYGIFQAATDGVGKAMILQMAPPEQKATAIGLFVGITGFCSLIASVMFGLIWEQFGSSWSFGVSAGLALLAALILLLDRKVFDLR